MKELNREIQKKANELLDKWSIDLHQDTSLNLQLEIEKVNDDLFLALCVKAFERDVPSLCQLLRDPRFDPKVTLKLDGVSGLTERKMFSWAIEKMTLSGTSLWPKEILSHITKVSGKKLPIDMCRLLFRECVKAEKLKDGGDCLEWLSSQGFDIEKNIPSTFDLDTVITPMNHLAKALVNPSDIVFEQSMKIALLLKEKMGVDAISVKKDDHRDDGGLPAKICGMASGANRSGRALKFCFEELGYDPTQKSNRWQYGTIYKWNLPECTGIPLFNLFCENIAYYKNGPYFMENFDLAMSLLPLDEIDSKGNSCLTMIAKGTNENADDASEVLKIIQTLISRGVSANSLLPKPKIEDFVKNKTLAAYFLAYEEKLAFMSTVDVSDLNEALQIIKERRAEKESNQARRKRL